MPIKVTLEDRDLRVRNVPDEIHEKLEEYVRREKRRGKPRLNKQTAAIELLDKALTKIKLD